MKKYLALIMALVLALGLVLTGCGGDKNPQTSNDPKPTASQSGDGKDKMGGNSGATSGEGVKGTSDETLRVVLSAEPDGLMPQYTESKASAAVNMCMYDTLVKWDTATNTYSEWLATAWEWVDETHLRFTLRDDVKFVNGETMTAEDVLYTFQVGSKYNNQTAYTRIFDVDNFVVEDDTHIVMALNAPYPTVLDVLGNDMYCIVSKAGIEANGGDEAAARKPLGIGTGKFTFTEWADGRTITLTRNDNYWRQDELPYYKQIVFTFVSDAASRAMNVESKDVDIASEIMATQVQGLEGNKDLTVTVFNTSTCRTFWMNCSSGPLANEKVRQAIFLLLDPNAVRTVANGGYGELAETNFSRYCSVYAAPGAGYVRQVDVARAKELLAEAGYPDGFTLKFMTVPTSQLVAEIVQGCLQEANIELEISLLEIGTYIGALFQGDYETYIGSADNWDVAKMLAQVDGRVPPFSAMGGAQYKDEALEKLIDAAAYEQDDAARKEAYAQVQAYVRDHFVNVGLCNETRIECSRTGLTGLKIDMRGYAQYADVRPAA